MILQNGISGNPKMLGHKLTFIHINVGSGIPFGGPHSNNAVSPLATRVSFGCGRKSSRKTVTTHRERGKQRESMSKRKKNLSGKYLNKKCHK